MSKTVAESFARACAARGPIRLCLERAGGGSEEICLKQPFAVVGSAPDADIVLDHPEISPRHAYLQIVGGRVFWVAIAEEAAESRPPSRVWPCGWLDAGRPLGAGPHRLWLPETGGGADAEPAADRPSPLSTESVAGVDLPSVTLEVVRKGRVEARWKMNRLLALVGRLPVCKLRLHKESVSRVHCALVLTPGGLWAVDLLSSHGVRVNGTRQRLARLDDGDELSVGDYRLRCRGADAEGGGDVAAEPQSRPALTVLPPAGELVHAGQALALAGNVDTPDGMRSVLLSLVHQFNAMQSQMFEQFQQTMLTMFQMYSAAHGEQVARLREELDRVNAATCELQAVQQELARGKAPADRAAASGTRTPARPAPRPSRRDTPIPEAAPQAEAAELHTMLYQRVEALQQERQSRWQRFLDLLAGRR